MALRLRRGTDAERLQLDGVNGLLPAEGELLYTTDTKKLYVGDGATAGGIAVDTGLTTLNASSIDDLLDVDTSEPINTPNNGDTLTWDSATTLWSPSPLNIPSDVNELTDIDNLLAGGGGGGIVEGGNYKFNLFGQDSSIMVDIDNNRIRASGGVIGDLTGDVISTGTSRFSGTLDLTPATLQLPSSINTDLVGNANGNHTGSFSGVVDGELIGSVFADDSTLLVDGVSGTITGTVTGTVDSSVGVSQFGKYNSGAITSLNVWSNDHLGFAQTALNVINTGDTNIANELGVYKTRGTPDAQTAVQVGDMLGGFSYAGFDGSVPQVGATIRGIVTDISAGNISTDVAILNRNGAIGTYTESLRIKADHGVVAQNYVQFGSYADAATRDAAITAPAAGMVVFVTDVAKFTGYDGSSWVNLN